MLTKTQKEKFISDFTADLKRAKGVYVTQSVGIDANTMNALRKKCREAGVRYVRAKNTLTKRALASVHISTLDKDLKGPVSFALSLNDGVAAAKILSEFEKENKEKFQIRGCVVEGNFYRAEDVSKLALLPSREVLLAQLLSVLQAPMRNLAGSLYAIVRNVAGALDAVAKQKAAGGGAEGVK